MRIKKEFIQKSNDLFNEWKVRKIIEKLLYEKGSIEKRAQSTLHFYKQNFEIIERHFGASCPPKDNGVATARVHQWLHIHVEKMQGALSMPIRFVQPYGAVGFDRAPPCHKSYLPRLRGLYRQNKDRQEHAGLFTRRRFH